MARILTIPAGRRGQVRRRGRRSVLVAAIVSGLFSGKFEDAQKNETASFLPGKAESVKALEAVKRFPGGELAPAVVVYERDGGLTAADKQRIDETASSRSTRDRPALVLPAQPPVFSRNGDAALVVAAGRAGRRRRRPVPERACRRSATASASPAAG